MRSKNARVLFRTGREPKEHKSVRVSFMHGWVHLEDEHGDVDAYPSDVVLSVQAKPTSYDRGS